MKTKIKAVCVLLMASLLLNLCGCGDLFDPDRITYIYFLSATSMGSCGNYFSLNEGRYTKAVRTMRGEDAKRLVQAVNGLPDNEGNEVDLAYIIEIKYREDGTDKYVKKCGYKSFPDNWEAIVDLVNKATANYARVTASRDITVIDAALMRKYTLFQDESVLPEGMTLDDVIRDMPVTYKTLCDYDWYESKILDEYLYRYFNLASNQMMEFDEHPKTSTYEELVAFAKSKMDEVYEGNKSRLCIGGSYKGNNYLFIKYDQFKKWYEEEDTYRDDYYVRSIDKDVRGLKYKVHNNHGPENMFIQNAYQDIYVDSSGRFLIFTDCKLLKDIYAVVK